MVIFMKKDDPATFLLTVSLSNLTSFAPYLEIDAVRASISVSGVLKFDHFKSHLATCFDSSENGTSTLSYFDQLLSMDQTKADSTWAQYCRILYSGCIFANQYPKG